MNRTIKFIAYDTKLKRMWDWEELKNLPMADFERDDLEFMQFTGLLDRHGKEIFEGDIVKYNKKVKGIAIEWSEPVQIIWNELTARFDFKDSFNGLFYEDYKIIGNIYENF